MPRNFKAVLLWSLIHNFWVCGVGSGGKDAFRCPDHTFLLGILITSFNCFCTFFLAGLSCSWGASPPSGGLEGQPEVVAVARITPVAEAGLFCLVVSGHILQTCWAAKPLQGLAARCPGGEGPGTSPGAAAPLVPHSVAARMCEQLGLEDCLPPAKLAVGMWSSVRAHEGQGLFLQGLVCTAGDSWEWGPGGTLISAGHRKARCLPRNPAGIQQHCWALPPLLLPSQATSLGYCSFIFLESTVDVFQHWLCTSAAIAQRALGPFISQARAEPCDSVFCHLVRSTLGSSCFKMAAILPCPLPCLKPGLPQTCFNSSSLWSIYPHVPSGGVGKGSFLF